MTDSIPSMILAATSLAGLMVVAAAGLTAWRDWLAVRRFELEGHHAPISAPTGARIELADLKERIRKLEAIAAGLDL